MRFFIVTFVLQRKDHRYTFMSYDLAAECGDAAMGKAVKFVMDEYSDALIERVEATDITERAVAFCSNHQPQE